MSIVDRISKFAAAQRVLEIQVGGNVFWNEILSGATAEVIGNRIAQALTANGWGVRDISTTWTPFNLSPRLYVYTTIQINAPLNEVPERVRQGVDAIARNFLDNVSASVISDSLYNQDQGGAITVNPTAQLGAGYEQPSIYEQVFGKQTSITDAGGKILGLSVSTLVIAGIAYVVLTSRKR